MNDDQSASVTHPVTRDRPCDERVTGRVTETSLARARPLPLKEPLTLGTDTDRAGGERTAARRALLNELHWLDHLAALIAELRPDWHRDQVRAAAASRDTPKATTITAAIACANDPDTRHPGRIASYDVRQPTPVPPSLRCAHGVAAITEDGRLVGIGCLRCRPPAAPVPRCEHGKPFGIGCCGATS